VDDQPILCINHFFPCVTKILFVSSQKKGGRGVSVTTNENVGSIEKYAEVDRESWSNEVRGYRGISGALTNFCLFAPTGQTNDSTDPRLRANF
jgi:hypothetical protein